MSHSESLVNGTSASNAEDNDLTRKLMQLLVDQANLNTILSAVLDKGAKFLHVRVLCQHIRHGRYDRAAIAQQLNVKPKVVTNKMSWARANGVVPVSQDDQFARIATELVAEGFAVKGTLTQVSSKPSTPGEVYSSEIPGTPQGVSSAIEASKSTPAQVSAAAAHDATTSEEVPSTPAEVELNANEPATTTSLHSLKNIRDCEVSSILSGSKGSCAYDSRARDGISPSVDPRQARLLEIAAPILKPTAIQRGLQRFEEIETLATTGGLDFELDITAGVSEVTRKVLDRIAAGQPPPSISTWRYFIGGIKDRAAARALQGQKGPLASKRDHAPISTIPETNGAKKPPADERGTQAQDLIPIRVFAGEIIDLDDARTLTQAELKSLAKNQELAEELRKSYPGISQEAVQAVIDRQIGDVIKQRDTYRKPLPTAEAFVLRAKGDCADIYLNANRAGTWKKDAAFDMAASEKKHAKFRASIERLMRSSEAQRIREADDRKASQERRIEDLASRWSKLEVLTSTELNTLEPAQVAVRRKKAQHEPLTPHEEKLMEADKDRAALQEENLKFWRQKQAGAESEMTSMASKAAEFKAQLAARQKTEPA